jgi:ElaB/YqjD/DUF883 family membrane-anchored ribosome-binding protein
MEEAGSAPASFLLEPARTGSVYFKSHDNRSPSKGMKMARVAVTELEQPKNRESADTDFEAHAEKIRNDIAELAQALSRAGGSLAGDVRVQTERQLKDLGSQLSALEHQLEKHVRDRPIAAIGFAAAAGFILALLVRR